MTPVWTAALVAFACVLLSGCDFNVPLTKAATHPVNPQLLGNWRERSSDRPALLTVRQLDDTAYIATVNGDVYRVHHSAVAARPFVSVQNLNDTDRKYCYYLWELSPGGSELTLRRVTTRVLPDTVASPEAAQRSIVDHLANPQLLEEPTVFVREAR